MDRDRKGRGPIGERHPNAKLKIADVEFIRASRGTIAGKDLAAEFGVHPTAISKIQLGKKWAAACA